MQRAKQILASLAFGMAMASAQAVTYIGAYDCGEWFKRPVAKAWLLGYLSGMNQMAAGYSGPLDRIGSAEQAYLWMDNFCKANPLKTIRDGAIDLFTELKAMSKP